MVFVALMAAPPAAADAQVNCAGPGFVNCSGAAAFSAGGCLSIGNIVTKCVSGWGVIGAGASSVAVEGGHMSTVINGVWSYTQPRCTWNGLSGGCADTASEIELDCVETTTAEATGWLDLPGIGPLAGTPAPPATATAQSPDDCDLLDILDDITQYDQQAIAADTVDLLDSTWRALAEGMLNEIDVLRGQFLAVALETDGLTTDLDEMASYYGEIAQQGAPLDELEEKCTLILADLGAESAACSGAVSNLSS